MVLSVADVVNGTADHEREFFRMLHPFERLALQGFSPELGDLLGHKLSVKAAGNAYPIPLIIASALPLLRAISENVDLLEWDSKLPADVKEVPEDMRNRIKLFRASLNRPPRVIKKQGRKTAKAS
jgi:hypothetical protein